MIKEEHMLPIESLKGDNREKGNIKSSGLEAFLGKNSSFKGKMRFQGRARLDGKFDGKIFSGDMLIIGETATVNAKINTSTLVIDGTLSGNVSVTRKIEIHATGKLYGNIATPTLVIEQGGLFDGSCRMEKEVEAKKNVTPIKRKEAEWIQGLATTRKNEMKTKIGLSWKRLIKNLFSHSHYNFLFIL
ncbi:MAG: hypothetical protein GTO13_00855 [Proteobacteria bacterium]|nr:hypothetical protein [Pseudomonadota bacterium]